MINPSAPIGIFDSGVGGLTVAQAIKQRMPEEQLIYFGDTRHMPYGDKSKLLIETYTQKITRFLIREGCKSIVIACNSASSNALRIIKQEVPQRVHVFDVIDPVIESLTFAAHHKLGVIATRATVQSDVYRRAIKKRHPHLEIVQMATPLLAPMIEEGFQNHEISHAVVSHYLSQKELKGIDTLILACTHYPIIKREIQNFYDGRIRMIDTPRIIADQIYRCLADLKLLSECLLKKDLFYVSALTDAFERQAKIFFGQKITLQLQDLNP
ncbi:MAG: glutamate racemase [Flavobacteriales bacterium]